MSSASTAPIQLRAEEPKPNDIFRVYRQNHPETLAFDVPDRTSGPAADFTPKTGITLRSTDGIWERTSILKELQDAGTISASTKQINLAIDVSDRLRGNNFEAAEHLLGRKLTDEEKQTKLLADKVGPAEEQAEREVNMEFLKDRAKLQRKKYIITLEKYRTNSSHLSAIAASRARAATLAAIEEIIEAGLASKKGRKDAEDAFAELANMFDEDPDLDPDNLPPAPERKEESDDDTASVATTIIAPKKPKSIASTVAAADNDLSEDDDDGIAPYVPKTPAVKPKKKEEIPVNSLYNDQWVNKPSKPTKPEYKVRIEKLLTYELRGMPDVAKGYKSASAAELENICDSLQEMMDRKVAEERGKNQAKQKGKHVADDGEEKESLPATGNGVNLFTGLRKMKNAEDYVKFGPRFLVDLKRLKVKSEFSLAYPKSGQKPNNIRNAILTPALKEVILAYIEGQPQDTTGLDAKEMEWLKLVWQQSGLQKAAPKLRTWPKQYKGKAYMKGRLKVLMGECVAGNDNPELLDEMSGIVDRMEEKGWLSQKDIINSRRFISGE